MTKANAVMITKQQDQQQQPEKERTTIMIYDHDGDNTEIVADGGGTIELSHYIPGPTYVHNISFSQIMEGGVARLRLKKF